jgi:hypothetical protein
MSDNNSPEAANKGSGMAQVGKGGESRQESRQSGELTPDVVKEMMRLNSYLDSPESVDDLMALLWDHALALLSAVEERDRLREERMRHYERFNRICEWFRGIVLPEEQIKEFWALIANGKRSPHDQDGYGGALLEARKRIAELERALDNAQRETRPRVADENPSWVIRQRALKGGG